MEIAEIFNDLPNLQTFSIDDIEAVTKDVFVTIHHKLMSYKGLEKLVLELVAFDLDDTKDLILDILK